MSSQYPFHYEIRAKLIAFDKNNNVRNESFTKVFDDRTPLENRANAFAEFNEYLSFIEQHERLKKNKQGNYFISQPAFISKKLEKTEISEIPFGNISIKKYFEIDELFDQYKEEISIILVVEDLSIAMNVIDAYQSDDKVQNEFVIHKVASSSYDAQDLIDNLDMREIPLYNYFKIDIEDHSEIVYHYGTDYAESGEDVESGAERTILKTPHIWDSLEMYEEYHNSDQTNSDINLETSFDITSIIEKGESNQVEFKPSLLYNFKTGEGGISVKYVISKAIAGFLNSNGGVLFIGVKDNGEIQGLGYDYSLFKGGNEKDKLLLELDSLIAWFFDLSIKPLVNASIESIDGKDVLVIFVTESHKPIFLKNKRSGQVEKEMFIRMNASTRQITDNEELVEYVLNKEW